MFQMVLSCCRQKAGHACGQKQALCDTEAGHPCDYFLALARILLVSQVALQLDFP